MLSTLRLSGTKAWTRRMNRTQDNNLNITTNKQLTQCTQAVVSARLMKLYLYDITNHTHEVYICRENAYIKTQVGQSTTSAFLVRSTSCAVVHWENARQNKDL